MQIRQEETGGERELQIDNTPLFFASFRQFTSAAVPERSTRGTSLHPYFFKAEEIFFNTLSQKGP